MQNEKFEPEEIITEMKFLTAVLSWQFLLATYPKPIFLFFFFPPNMSGAMMAEHKYRKTLSLWLLCWSILVLPTYRLLINWEKINAFTYLSFVFILKRIMQLLFTLSYHNYRCKEDNHSISNTNSKGTTCWLRQSCTLKAQSFWESRELVLPRGLESLVLKDWWTFRSKIRT